MVFKRKKEYFQKCSFFFFICHIRYNGKKIAG